MKFEYKRMDYSVLFRRDSKGRKIFYPWGELGNGYVLPEPSDEMEENLKNFLMLSFAIGLILMSAGIFMQLEAGVIGWIYNAMFISIAFVISPFLLRRKITGLEVISPGSEYYSPATIDKRGKAFFIVMAIIGLIGGIDKLYNEGLTIDGLWLLVGSVIILATFGYLKLTR